MGNLTNEENWAARERLRRVEFWLWWRGWVGRQDLVDAFGISAAQASGDLQRYAALNAGAMIYQTSRKRYEATEGMVCVLHEPVFEEAVRFFLGGDLGSGRGEWGAREAVEDRVSMIAMPRRRMDVRLARRIWVALLEQRVVRVRYVSVHSAKREWRELVPRAMGWVAGRWHMRAWCGTRQAWRDFVLGRIEEAEWPGQVVKELPVDVDWETFEVVEMRLNPELGEEQRRALRMDYDLSSDVLAVRVRRSMMRYFLDEMRLSERGNGAGLSWFVRV